MIGLQRDVLLVAPAASFHHPPHHHHHAVDAAAAALLSPVDHSIIPLLTAAPCLPEDPDGRSRLNLWQGQQPGPQSAPWGNALQTFVIPGVDPTSSSSYLCKPVPVPALDSAASATTAAGGILSGGAGAKGLLATGVVVGVGDGGLPSFTTCQDCGNKAKKDCVHRRCRTCCKSRGFACSTHVKSTWLPAAQRRERQVSSSAAAAPGGGSSASTCSAKKPRLLLSDGQTATTNTTSTTSNTATPPRSFDTAGSSHQDAELRRGLPEQVRAAAVFKCVRVTTIDDGEDEYAYQGMVKIGGHIFKGFLYDQGVAGEGDDATGIGIQGGGDHNTDVGRHSRNPAIPNLSDLHLGGGGGGDDGGASDLFAAGLDGGLIGGTPYGNPIN